MLCGSYLDICRWKPTADWYCCRAADNWNRDVAKLKVSVNPSRLGRSSYFDGIVPVLFRDDPFVAPSILAIKCQPEVEWQETDHTCTVFFI